MLTVEGLGKIYEQRRRGRRSRRSANDDSESPPRAIDHVDLQVNDGELFTLLGPSGCGKTTTLRCIAGLEDPDEGVISLYGRILFSAGRPEHPTVNLSPPQRGLGMVFQSYAIWPHMSVFDNVAFPLQVQDRRKRRTRKQIADNVMRALDLMQLSSFAQRPATRLSGGQQQRLALARALVAEPPLLLLDEPLSNLDAKLRESLRVELKRLQSELGVTSIYVTHDQSEALSMSSRIAVMSAGRIEQIDVPMRIYNQPTSRFVAEFIGISNFFPGHVREVDHGSLTVETADGLLRAEGVPADSYQVGQSVLVSIRPEALEISTRPPDVSRPNIWHGKIRDRSFLGDAVDHHIVAGNREFRCRSTAQLTLDIGAEVRVYAPPAAVAVVPH